MASIAAKQVAEEVLSTIGKGKMPNIEKLAVKHGYSKNSARAGLVQQTKTFRDIIEKALPDTKLTALHKKLLEKKEIVITGVGRGESEWEYTGQPHSDALKALETAYKLKGRYSDESHGDTNVQINIINHGDNNPAPIRAEELPA